MFPDRRGMNLNQAENLDFCFSTLPERKKHTEDFENILFSWRSPVQSDNKFVK